MYSVYIMNSKAGTIYIVGTPIGNLKDITLRALEVLSTVPVIACEDTRHTKILLHEHGIFDKNPEVKLVSFHTHSKAGERSNILTTLQEGKDVALVSDAGTPCISDPGTLLLEEIRTYNKTLSGDDENVAGSYGEIKIVPIPGASALVTALSAFGVMGGRFEFVGFIPHKKGRETLIKHMIESKIPVVCYESPHRIMKTLEAIVGTIKKYDEGTGDVESYKLYIGRELTKMFEEIIIGNPSEVLEIFTKNEDTKDRKDRGEFVLMIERLK